MEVDSEGVLPDVPLPLAAGPAGLEKGQEERMLIKLPVLIRLPDGCEENSRTENLSKSGLCFACSIDMQVGDTVYVSVGLDPPEDQRDIPASILWRRPPKGKARVLYGAKLERRE